jgi:rsbT co-antagonist protein RsbR
LIIDRSVILRSVRCGLNHVGRLTTVGATSLALVNMAPSGLEGSRAIFAMPEALAAIERTGARRLLLDLTGAPVIDTYVAKGLIEAVRLAQLLGTRATLIGIKPEVAQTIAALGVDLHAVPVGRDLQSMPAPASVH